ncbi:MAG: alpha-E domain-containing protein [Chlorobium sp.]|uniref:alpha-E domain-containing protein n=1 Tax=Chlorobium sp. TaxID=1095 RepID=UPI0025C4B666|nr:alpha-E domain-containing protein [Chlorobium sp.]MCF8216839.1 alpha-E domain-containing protein [Chlorobium sp.]MCF8271684.1 alpha-E domain-containing protein [Chlorobium sp.]MCF8288056.1 alpha-E domain-containing protein [Chlorobium sp.]MCF8291640.1 alpha-E domain-containing protein [Chlorobium sp.]MCF8385755.1 alpha-E domain-containing protein [Chlorobium sp.]
MLSRVAESLFWMSRYVERAENTARFLEVNFNLLLDLNDITEIDNPNYWNPLIRVTAKPEHFIESYPEYNAYTVTDYLVFNRQNSNSIISSIGMARENARSIIDSISSEMWEQVNNLYHFLQNVTQQQVHNDPFSFYREIKNASHLFQGITDNIFSRTEGWEFIQIGKYLERADNAARLIDVKYLMLMPKGGREQDPVLDSFDTIQWMAVLKSCSALEAFRKVYLSKIDPENILWFLVLDRTFPRSIAFSICAAQEALWRISGSSRHRYANNVDRLIGKLEAELSYTSVEDMYNKGLHRFIEEIEHGLNRIGEQIHLLYFAYHTPKIEPHDINEALPFTGLVGGRANWSQSQQQQ